MSWHKDMSVLGVLNVSVSKFIPLPTEFPLVTQAFSKVFSVSRYS